MKKIKTIILAAAALLAFAPAVSAQSTSTIANVINTANGYAGTPDFSRSATNTYTVKKNVAFSKQISEPLSDGTYWIKLEAFATGSATEEVSSTPSDVLLILDVSTSMTNNMYPVGSTTTRLNALKDAVKAFIASIYDNAVSASAAAQSAGITYDGNRIGIISFGGFARDDTEGWLDVQNNRGALDGIVDELATGDKGTWTSSGLRVAIENYLDGDPYAARTNANLTVVIFTDGEPATAGSGDIEIDGERTATTQNAFSSYIANNAVYYSHIMKSQYNASVFTVTLLGNSPDSRVKPFAELMSLYRAREVDTKRFFR